ncbi:MAG TPA: class A beta-lactamase [Rhodanobacteraceae bacterium]|jgi:beta-lactamase class A|nr:class A beta-lactamase [Rhodanobacteraceae bacterium]
MRRRDVLKGMALGGAAIATGRMAPALAHPALGGAEAHLAMLERRHGGRLGVAILDTGSGRREGRRGDERFLMCSTFKLVLVAAVLQRVDAGTEQLDRRIVFGKDALLDYAPITKQHVGPPGMTMAALSSAAMMLSDNTAANLLLKEIGGPHAVTACARSLGDPVTRLDRNEPTLNRPHGEWDTTSPNAMLADMHKLLLGNALSRGSRERLTRWLLQCGTGRDSLRAGLPHDWREGDKTGSGNTATNDIAILWPPHRKPLLVTSYYMNDTTDASTRKVVLAEVGRTIASM